MVVSLTFNCKHPGCNAKNVYEHDNAKNTTVYKGIGSGYLLDGKILPREQICPNKHKSPYAIVKFKCKQCNLLVVATTESEAYYPAGDSRVIDGKVTLTCENGHQAEYKVKS